MNRNRCMKNRRMTIAWRKFAMIALVLPSVAWAGQGQHLTARNPRTAPIEQYLMDRNAEIALARSAAPESISRDAEVLVLGPQGYETAAKGKNGFVCIVQRAWTAAYDDPEFGSPRHRYPICYNPAAVRSQLPIVFKKTELALAGASKVEFMDRIKAAFDKKELSTPEPGSMCYMMSKQAYFGKRYGRFHPHLMFFFPLTDGAAWGAGLPGSPIEVHEDPADHLSVYAILVDTWSDGTVAPSSHD
jgi:hypothetical protein